MKHLKFASWKQPKVGRPRFKENKFSIRRSRKASYSSKKLSTRISRLRHFKKKNHKKNSSSSIAPHLKRAFKELFNHNAQRRLISFSITQRIQRNLEKALLPFPFLGRNSFVGERNVGRLSQVQLRLIPSEWSENGGAPVHWNNRRRGWKGRVSIIKCRVTHPGN